VLERMNRGYTRERYLELIAELRAAVPEIALSTDLIVGFPGETEDDFQATLDMVEQVGYDNVFAFRYSPRPGTPAAGLPDQVAPDVKASRNARVLETAGRVAAERSRLLEGHTLEVLVDGLSKRNEAEMSGRTRCNRVVNFHGQHRVSVGDVVPVRVTEALPHSLRGVLASRPEDAECSSR
jgi:tRNA-2-methylthio-N6-dimethylallyladenosine synthase